MKARMVRTAYRFASVMFSPTPPPIVFLARMPRRADERLEPIAAMKPTHVNESSCGERTKMTSSVGLARGARMDGPSPDWLAASRDFSSVAV